MKCPICNGKTVVLYDRLYDNGISRRRHCTQCRYRFVTLEIVAPEGRHGRMLTKLNAAAASALSK